MSVKAMSLVWDLECPKEYGEVAFKPSHKYVLIAYADHADHNGKNIWPAVPTIARKTGLDDRTVQRLTGDLEAIGLLVEDGKGPRGTNKWYMPFNERGDKLTPLANCRGDKSEESLGDIPSGDIPSGDKLTPEVKEPEPINITKEVIAWNKVKDILEEEMPNGSFAQYVQRTRAASLENDTLMVLAENQDTRGWLESRVRKTAERMLVGILAQTVDVVFVVIE